MAYYSFRHKHEFKRGQLICGRCRHTMRLGAQGEKMMPANRCVAAVTVSFSADKQLLTVRASDVEERLRELESSKDQNQQ